MPAPPPRTSCDRPLAAPFQFVVIPPSPAGPRPLTEHQREVRAAPRDSIPALYADLSQDTQQLAAAAAAPDDSQTSGSAELSTPGQTAAAGSRQGARRRLLGVESQPEQGAVSFAGAVAAARGAADSEEPPSRAAPRRRPLRLRQSLPGPGASPVKGAGSDGARKAADEPAAAVTVNGVDLHGEEAMDATPAAAEDPAPSTPQDQEPRPEAKTAGGSEQAVEVTAKPAVEVSKTPDKTEDAAVPGAADAGIASSVTSDSQAESAGEGDSAPTAGDASPPGRRSRPRRNTKRSPQVAAFISSARRLLEADDRRRRRRSEPGFRSLDESDDTSDADPAAAESAPAALRAPIDPDELPLLSRLSSKKSRAQPEESSDGDVASGGRQTESEPAPAGGEQGARLARRSLATEVRLARSRRRRTAVVEISARRLMEESPPEPMAPPAAVAATGATPTKPSAFPTAAPEETPAEAAETEASEEKDGRDKNMNDVSAGDSPSPKKRMAPDSDAGSEPSQTQESAKKPHLSKAASAAKERLPSEPEQPASLDQTKEAKRSSKRLRAASSDEDSSPERWADASDELTTPKDKTASDSVGDGSATASGKPVPPEKPTPAVSETPEDGPAADGEVSPVETAAPAGEPAADGTPAPAAAAVPVPS